MDVESTFVCEGACSHTCTWRRWGTSTDTGVWNQSEGEVRNPPPHHHTRLLDCLHYRAEKWQQIYGIRVWKANEINRVAELIWNAVFRVTKRGAVCKSVRQYQSARQNNTTVSRGSTQRVKTRIFGLHHYIIIEMGGGQNQYVAWFDRSYSATSSEPRFKPRVQVRNVAPFFRRFSIKRAKAEQGNGCPASQPAAER